MAAEPEICVFVIRPVRFERLVSTSSKELKVSLSEAF